MAGKRASSNARTRGRTRFFHRRKPSGKKMIGRNPTRATHSIRPFCPPTGLFRPPEARPCARPPGRGKPAVCPPPPAGRKKPATLPPGSHPREARPCARCPPERRVRLRCRPDAVRPKSGRLGPVSPGKESPAVCPPAARKGASPAALPPAAGRGKPPVCRRTPPAERPVAGGRPPGGIQTFLRRFLATAAPSRENFREIAEGGIQFF